MKRKRERDGRNRRRLRLEQLESRMMLAGDAIAAIELEVVDGNGDPLSRVEVGDEFVLRGNARDLRGRGDGVFAAYADVSYGAGLVAANGALQVSGGFPAGVSGDATTPGVIEEVGGFRQPRDGAVDTSQQVFFEMPFVAQSAGEVLFAANPADAVPTHDILVLGSNLPVLPEEVNYGFLRLQIGDPREHPPSPWRNPGNPFDVNNNGVVTVADAELIEEALSDKGEHELTARNDGGDPLPYFDVTGDGFVRQDDAQAVHDQFGPPRPEPPTRNPIPTPDPCSRSAVLEHLISIVAPHAEIGESCDASESGESAMLREIRRMWPDLQEAELGVRLDVTNTRTGESASNALVGDVLQVRGYLTGELDRIRDRPGLLTVYTASTLRIAYDPDQVAIFPSADFRLNGPAAAETLAQTGEAPLFDLQFVVNAPSDVIISTQFGNHLASGRLRLFNPIDAGLRELPDDVVQFLDDAIDERIVTLNVDVSANRPTSQHDAFEFGNSLPLQIPASDGLLANDAPSSAALQAQLVVAPSKGDVTVRADGSFVYHPRHDFGGSDLFQYVAVSSTGTSELANVVISGELPPVVEIILRAVDEAGNPLTSVRVGQEFYLQGLAEDLRGAPAGERRGVYDVEVEVGFDPAVVALNGDVTLGKLYDTFSFGETSLPGEGLIGARGYSGLTSTGLGEHEFFRVPMVAIAAGNAELSINSLGQVQIMLFGGSVPKERISVIDSPLEIEGGSRWQNQNDSLDANNDGFVTSVDVLIGINQLNLRGAVALGESDMMMGGKQVYLDSNGDGYHAPVDVLLIVNDLNSRDKVVAEGEAATDEPPPAVLSLLPQTTNTRVRESMKREERTTSADPATRQVPINEQARPQTSTNARRVARHSLVIDELLPVSVERTRLVDHGLDPADEDAS